MALESLVTYLEPRFGNLSDYPSWTDELRSAVRRYLVEVIPDELYVRFLAQTAYAVPLGTREEQANFILDEHSPVDVGAAFHFAAVVMTPTLDQLIDAIESASSTGDRGDAALWLTARGVTDLQIIRMAQDTGHTELLETKRTSGWQNPDAYDLARVLTLPELRAAWEKVSFVWQRRKPRTTKASKPTRDSATSSPADGAKVRQWARAEGYEVGVLGRLPANVVAAYTAAQQQTNQVEESSEAA